MEFPTIQDTPNPKRKAREVHPARHVFREKTGAKTASYCYPYGGDAEPIYKQVTAKREPNGLFDFATLELPR